MRYKGLDSGCELPKETSSGPGELTVGAYECSPAPTSPQFWYVGGNQYHGMQWPINGQDSGLQHIPVHDGCYARLKALMVAMHSVPLSMLLAIGATKS